MRFSWPWQSDARDELITVQREQIAMLKKQNEELRALFNKTSAFEIVEQTESGVKLRHKPITAGVGVPLLQGRSGWRSQRVAAEKQTVPEPSDSVQALEKRVQEAKNAISS